MTKSFVPSSTTSISPKLACSDEDNSLRVSARQTTEIKRPRDGAVVCSGDGDADPCDRRILRPRPFSYLLSLPAAAGEYLRSAAVDESSAAR